MNKAIRWALSLLAIYTLVSLAIVWQTLGVSASASKRDSAAQLLVVQFNDRNANGLQEGGEETLTGQLIRVYKDRDGLLQQVGADTVANAEAIPDLAPGAYQVWQQLANCWSPTSRGVYWRGGYLADVQLSAGDVLTVKFGQRVKCASAKASGAARVAAPAPAAFAAPALGGGASHPSRAQAITPTAAPTDTPTNTPTNTPVAPTPTPTDTPTNTPVAPTATPTDTPTNTPVAPTPTPTDTPTNTPVAPTATPTDTPTNTPVAPTPTPTNTPTNTPVPPTPTPTNTPTNTPVPPTPTPTNTPFPFSGFFQPVDNQPAVNQVKAGRAVPVKFSLGGYLGLNILAPGYPKSQQIPCATDAALDPVEETTTAGNSTLTYDASSNQYIYVWKTEKSWAGTCRQFTLRLIDGYDHIAYFNFVR